MKGSALSFEHDRFRLWCLALVWGPSTIQPACKPVLGQGKVMVLCWWHGAGLGDVPLLLILQIAVPYGPLGRESGQGVGKGRMPWR